MMKKNLIFINPWIYDFAAYDLWSKPIGLLYLISYLGRCGFNVHLIDCLDIYNPYMKKSGLKKPKRRAYGTGKLWKQMIPKPSPLSWVKRPYYRYGITPEILEKELKQIPCPDAFIITSLMTYWYLGVKDVIKVVKKIYPDVPVLLGGIYARLCKEHAEEKTGADIVISSYKPEDLLAHLIELGIYPEKEISFAPSTTYPAFELYKKLDYICIITSRGCPYRCSYCASSYLNPGFCKRAPEDVFEEICYWHKKGIIDFAFYDDALLVSAEHHFVPLLEMIIKKGLKIRFHTPNAIHLNELNKEIASLMHRAGFETIRLGLESIDTGLHEKLDRKIEIERIEEKINFLFEAGFKSHQIGAYILIGLPEQEIDPIIDTIRFTERIKIIPFLAEYSPIPHTALWNEAVKSSFLDISSEPIYHNNILLPCWDEKRKSYLPLLKGMVIQVREKIRHLYGGW